MADSSASKHRHRRPGRRRLAPLAVVAGVVASAAIATSMTGTLGAFTAQILNSNNSTATGVLTMSETGPNNNNNSTSPTTCTSTDSTTVSTNSATCSSINKYGAGTTFIPGSSATTTVTITNTGTVKANTFTLTPGVCQQGLNGSVNGSATDFCSKVMVSITQNGTTLLTPTSLATFGGTAASPAGPTALTALTAGSSSTFVFTVSFPSTGATDNTYQGLKASQTLTWNFTS